MVWNLAAVGRSAVAAGGAGYQIARSLRCNSADSADLTRALPATPTSRTKLTAAVWVKRSKLQGTIRQIIFSASTTEANAIHFNATENLCVIFGASLLTSVAVYRDVTAWMHVVIAIDTGLATATDRVKVYVNGTLITMAGTPPPLNYQLRLNNAEAQYINRYWASDYSGHNGSYAEFVCVDGQQLDASSFGELDAITLAWNPKAYAGTYGNNGFRLDFADNSNTTAATLGKDTSGNNNDWAPTNFSVAAGVGNDSLTDTPTNYGTDTGIGGEVRGNYCTLNPLWANPSLVFTEGNLVATNLASAHRRVSSTFLIQSGRWYWEAVYQSTAPNGNDTIGVADPSVVDFQAASFMGTAGAWVITSAGNFHKSSAAVDATYTAFTTNNILAFAYDADNGRLYVGKISGGTITWMNSGDPVAATGYLVTGIAVPVVPAAAPSFLNASLAFNFGQRAFAATAPAGFKALCTQNFPAPAILKPSDYFTSHARGGTGAAFNVTGKPFQPDLIWIKQRNATASHALYDSVRGVQKDLAPDDLTAETTEAQGITAFNATGYSGGTLGKINTLSSTYIEWLWKKGVTPGLDIVPYTGDGVLTRVISHALGVAPGLLITKRRSAATFDWCVWHKSFTGTGFLFLSSSAAFGSDSTIWNSTVPTASVFSVGTYGGVNTNAVDYIAYLFAEVPGFSKFGTYVGNVLADGPVALCGFRPAFVLLKSLASNSWYVFDAVRNSFNPVDAQLNPDLALGESSPATYHIDFLAHGFKLRGTGAGINASAQTFVFAAFAERPFKTARAR